MERKIVAKRKVNKSQQIREFLAANAGVGPTEAAKQLSSQLGTKITPAFVSNIKQKLTKSGGNTGKGRRGKPGRKPGVRTNNRVSNNRPGSDAVSVIRAAQQFIAAAGGVEQAREVLSALGGGIVDNG